MLPTRPLARSHGISRMALTSARRTRYRTRGLAVQPIVPPAVWTCEASFCLPRTSAPRTAPDGPILAARPILPAMRRSGSSLSVACDAVSPLRGARRPAGPDRPGPDPDAASRRRSIRPRQGDAGQRRGHGPALRVADRVRRRPRSSGRPSPNRGGSRTDGTAGHLPPPPGPDVLRRQPARAVGRRPQLAPPHRPGASRRRWPRSSSTSRAPRRTCAARTPTRRRSACAPTTTASDVDRRPRPPAADFVEHRRRPDVRGRAAGRRRRPRAADARARLRRAAAATC